MVLVLEVEDPSVAGARRGDPLAWADLHERYHLIIHRYLEVVDPDALDDIEAVWDRAARTLPGQPVGVAPLIWLIRTARNVMIHRPSPNATDDPTIRAIRSLDPVSMDVLALRVVAGLSERDVALVMGRSIERIREVAHHGLALLTHEMSV